MTEVTRILNQLAKDESERSDQLLPLLYNELRKLARVRINQELNGNSFDATELVHEAYVRLVSSDDPVSWESRGHFFSAASEAMRRILVERARRRKTVKHGGELQRIEFDDRLMAPAKSDDKLLQLSSAIDRLEQTDSTKAQLVKLRYFAGFTVEEAAHVLNISKSKAERMWVFTRAWLQAEISESPKS